MEDVGGKAGESRLVELWSVTVIRGMARQASRARQIFKAAPTPHSEAFGGGIRFRPTRLTSGYFSLLATI
jgi:hypothetical protein